MIRIVLALSVLSTIFGCKSVQSITKDKCLNRAFDLIIANDISTILYQEKELLLVVNFFDRKQKVFSAAIIDKETFPEYLSDKHEKAKGYGNYKGFIVVFYGKISKELNLQPINEHMKYMIPLNIEKPKAGQPPIQPSIIEPSIYTFKKSKNCYLLLQKTIADDLLK